MSEAFYFLIVVSFSIGAVIGPLIAFIVRLFIGPSYKDFLIESKTEEIKQLKEQIASLSDKIKISEKAKEDYTEKLLTLVTK